MQRPEIMLGSFRVERDGVALDRVHALTPPPGEPVNVARQQTRAHNLANALRDLDGDGEGLTCVVGGGFAGLTCGVALALAGRPTVVFEQAGRLILAQWKSYDRYLHPEMFDWPEAAWRRGAIGNPALPWRDHFAAAVRATVLDQVPDDDLLAFKFNASVRAIRQAEREDEVEVDVVTLDDGQFVERTERFVRVVVASGFPTERPPSGMLGGSYWRTPTDRSSIPPAGVRIVGNGDGGLTELITLGVEEFRQDRLRNLIDYVDDVAPDAGKVGDPRWEGLHAALRDKGIASALGEAVAPFPLLLYSNTKKLTTRSFLLNACAAVAVEQAREEKGLPPVFEEPAGTNYGASQAEEDAEAGRAVVWRGGPGGAAHLVRGLNLEVAPDPAAADPAVGRWDADFADAVRTELTSPRRHEASSVDVPSDKGKRVRSALSGPLFPLPRGGAEHDDVMPALDAVARAALAVAHRPEAVDRTAAHVVDGVIHAAVDAVGAVASLPAGVVVDALLASGSDVRHSGRCLFVRRPAGETEQSAEPRFETAARHVVIDAFGIEATLSGRSDPSDTDPGRARGAALIDEYLDDETLVEALMLAVRARRRRVTLPDAVLTRLQRREHVASDEATRSRLLRLVAVALVPATARSQGRTGLARLGRAAAAQPWIRDELAAFFFSPDLAEERAADLPRQLLLDAVRPIGSPLNGTQVLQYTRKVLQIWVAGVAPKRGASPVGGLSFHAEQLAPRIRELIKDEELPAEGLDRQVSQLLDEPEIAQRLTSDGGDGTALRMFGLRIVPTGVTRQPRRPRAR